MENALTVLVGGAVGAALVKVLDNVIMHILGRRAKKKDAAQDAEIVSLKTIYDELKGMKDENTKQSHALRIIMYDRILYLVQKAIKETVVPIGLRTDIDRMYRSYKGDLDANGDLESVMELFYKLPVKT